MSRVKHNKREVEGRKVTPPLPDNSRVANEIERTLGKGGNAANMQRIKHNKGRDEPRRLKAQEIPNTLDAQSEPLDETPPVGSRGTATTSMPESGTPLAPPLPILCGVLTAPTFSTSTLKDTDVWLDAHSLCMNSPP